MQSFFSQTLTVLYLTDCRNVPLTLFLVCPNLREVYLDDVEVLHVEVESGDDDYPDTQCSGRELPALERLSYRNSRSLIKQLITPPPEFSMAVVIWSKLRVLKLCPQEKGGLVFLQPILDAACNTLEELYLTNIVRMTWNIPGKMWSFLSIRHELTDYQQEQLSLAGLVDLRHIPNLRIFAIYAIIKCDAREPAVLHDINVVLGAIPQANQVTKLSLDFTIYGNHPFGGCLEEDWVGMCDAVARISAGKPLELNLEMSISPANFQYPPPGRDELYERIKEKIASLSDHPNICTHWHPRSGMI